MSYRSDNVAASDLSVTHLVVRERGEIRHRVYASIGWYGVLGNGVSLDDAREAVLALISQIATVRDGVVKLSDYRGIADRRWAPMFIARVHEQAESRLQEFMRALDPEQWAGSECTDVGCEFRPPVPCPCGCASVLFRSGRESTCPSCGCNFEMRERP